MSSFNRLTTTLVLLSLLATAPSTRAELLAVSWQGNATIVDECTGEALATAATGYFQLNSLARNSHGEFYTVGSSESGNIFAEQILLTVDPLTGIASAVAPLPLIAGVEGTVRALAFSPDDVLYAITRTPYAQGVATLCTIDVVTGDVSYIGETGTSGMQGLAFSNDGILYGLDFVFGLGIVDIESGAFSLISGATPGFGLDSLGFGPNGLLYAIQHDQQELYALDPSTGEARLIGTGDYDDVRGVEYIPGSSPDPEPPTVACSVAAATLKVRNGQLVDVGLQIEVTDHCNPFATFGIQVYCNEDAEGDAVLGTDTLSLRAQRDGSGDGRVYLIVVRASNVAGEAIDCCTVTVAHDGSTAAELAAAAEAEWAESVCYTTGLPPEDYILIESTPIP